MLSLTSQSSSADERNLKILGVNRGLAAFMAFKTRFMGFGQPCLVDSAPAHGRAV